MAIEIQPGDVVVLKSGGPAMTVTMVGDNYGVLSVWCSWFEQSNNHKDIFPLVAVEKDD